MPDLPPPPATATPSTVPSAGRRACTVLLAATVLVVGLAACGADDATSEAAASAATGIEGVDTFPGLARDHTDEAVEYGQEPPVGGPHAPVWQNCGAYDQPVDPVNGVHSMEHGAVWITFDPTLPDEDVNQLLGRAAVSTHVLVSPREDLPTPVVASAWGVQLQLDDATDDRLDEFLDAYVQGPQTPEPGVTCADGTGQPL